MLRGSITWGGEVGTVWNGKIVPKLLIGVSCCRNGWNEVPLHPRIIIGGWGDGSGVVAYEESPSRIVVKSSVRAG